ncbi:esterase-like activity of phytase family protein [Micromonospora sp. NPDC092111]|uniref:esterase-like activity of phytase family protein n=1 Tax=Micromonospora sp. NPDC092111 TaxID=3364289 RepID=UPI0038291217
MSVTKGIGLAAAMAGLILTIPGGASAADRKTWGAAELVQFAALPAQTFVPGSEPSGTLLGGTPSNGITPPFADQPVQGFSGILRNSDGSYDVLSDNGYGGKANSGDFLLRIQRVAPDFAGGTVDVVGGINLTDPFGRVPFPLTRADRVLTGADFDVESIMRTADGTYWIGDEFGPYLLHFDRAGRLLQAPVPLPGVFAPEHPDRGEQPANLGGSKGFEGMALSPDGRTLYPLLEGTVTGDAPGSLRLHEFDIASSAYTGRRWTYQLDDPKNAIGDAIAVDRDRFLIIERDNGQGDTAKTKKIYLADRHDRDRDGRLDKTLVADLMNIANPKRVGGFGTTFTFPFQTIEDVVILDNRTLVVVNDNNFPFSSGRSAGKPDDNEFIVLRVDRSLDVDKRILRRH